MLTSIASCCNWPFLRRSPSYTSLSSCTANTEPITSLEPAESYHARAVVREHRHGLATGSLGQALAAAHQSLAALGAA
jgi:hypothetical protein